MEGISRYTAAAQRIAARLWHMYGVVRKEDRETYCASRADIERLIADEMAMEDNALEVDAVLIPYTEGWVVQCVTFDIAAQGAEIREALNRFAQTVLGEYVLAQEHGTTMPDRIGRPPDYLVAAFKEGLDVRDNGEPYILGSEQLRLYVHYRVAQHGWIG